MYPVNHQPHQTFSQPLCKCYIILETKTPYVIECVC